VAPSLMLSCVCWCVELVGYLAPANLIGHLKVDTLNPERRDSSAWTVLAAAIAATFMCAFG
jgi:hypothetical protein